MKKVVVRLSDFGVGKIANDKMIARKICKQEILPSLELEVSVVIDFSGVEILTQGFMHALISGGFEKFGEIAYQHLFYRNVTESDKEMIEIIYNSL